MKGHAAGYALLANTIILFSTYEVVSKTLVGRIDPFQINFIRFFIGGVILFLYLAFKGDLKITGKDFLKVSLTGVLNVVISMNLVQLSLYEDNAQASVVAVIFSSNPIFVTLFAAVLDRERINASKAIGMLLGIIGVVVIFADKISLNINSLKGPLYALLSAVFFALYTVLGKKISSRIGSVKLNSYSFMAGSLLLLPILILQGRPVIEFDYSVSIQMVYLSVLVTGLAYMTFFKGLAITGASKGSLVFFIKPVLASIIAIIFLGEKGTITLVAGTLLILAGIFTVIYMEEGFRKEKT